MAPENGKIRQDLTEVTLNPGSYLLGSLPVELELPRAARRNMSGLQVTFSPDQAHTEYLIESNRSPMAATLESQGSVYARETILDGRQIIIANSLSPYTVNGDHLIVWCPGKDGIRYQQTFREMGIRQGQEAFRITSSIARIYESENGPRNFYIGINVQTDEWQRQTVQSIRDAVHLHAVRMTEVDIIQFQEVKDRHVSHEFADNFATLSLELFSQVVVPELDKIGANAFFSEAFGHSGYKLQYPKGYFFRLKEGWETLKSEDFFPFLVNLQIIFENAYKELRACFTDERLEMFRFIVGEDGKAKEEPFMRPLPFENDEIVRRVRAYLEKHLISDKKTQRRLLFLASTIKPASDVLERNSEKNPGLSTDVPKINVKAINTKMIMDGLGYNILFFPDPIDKGAVLMSIVPRVTSAGSPLDAFGIKKTQYEVEQAEFESLMASADARRDTIVRNLITRHPSLVQGSALEGRPVV